MKKKMKQMHIDIELETYEAFQKILPDKRMLAIGVRQLIREFVEKHKDTPVDAIKFMMKKDKE